jgi:CsoR family transcriptional regulator, copper-sensing transcriptional repressor
MMTKAEKARQKLIARLKKIEGQVRGLQRMIEEEAECEAMVTQLTAVRAALDKVGFIVLSHRMEECLMQNKDGKNREDTLEEAMKLFLKLS